MSGQYSHIRFRWWLHLDLNEVYDELKDEFNFEKKEMPSDKQEISLYKYQRTKLLVTAGTLKAYLGFFRVILIQTKAKPFTNKDLKLREKVFELYPHNRSTPFPW